jgi:hypothetical protein
LWRRRWSGCGYRNAIFSGIELGKMLKVGDLITVLDRQDIVTHIGREQVTLLTGTHDCKTLANLLPQRVGT